MLVPPIRPRVALLLCSLLAPASATAQDLGPVPLPPPAPPEAPPSYGGPGGAAEVPPPPAAPLPPSPPPPAAEQQPPAASAALEPSGERQPPAEMPDDEGRRSLAEALELYGTAFGLGAFAAIGGLVWADAEDVFLYLSLPLLGGTAGVGAVLALDSDPGMPAGVPSAISTGIYLGLADGFLLWGGLDAHLGTDQVFGLLLGSSFGGALLGALVGYGLRPTIADNRLVAAAALWGGWTSLMTALAFDVKSRAVWRATLAGTNVLAGLAVVVGSMTDIPLEVVGGVTGMMFTGTLVGLMVAGIIHADADRDGRSHGSGITAAGVAIGSGAGLGLGVLVMALEASERDEDEEEDPDADAEHGPRSAGGATFDLGALPVRGGAMVAATVRM